LALFYSSFTNIKKWIGSNPWNHFSLEAKGEDIKNVLARKKLVCFVKEGWTGRLCDTPGWGGEEGAWRPGKCLPLGSFLCMNGGTEVCRWQYYQRQEAEYRRRKKQKKNVLIDSSGAIWREGVNIFFSYETEGLTYPAWKAYWC
jgi:hypothetical protein